MRKILSYCHPSFSLENIKGSSNYEIIKSGRSLDLAYQLGAMTRRGYSRDCHVNNDNNSLSYVREADNKNLLAGELEKLSNLPHLFLLVSSACKQSLTRFGHRVCNACCASLFASLQANKCVTCGKIAFSKQFYPRPLLARRGKEKEVIIRDCHVASLLTMTIKRRSSQ